MSSPSIKPRPRIVVAEDQLEMRALICHYLRREGFEVHEATNGLHLVDLLVSAMTCDHRPWKPDLIVSDVRMPGASGLDVLARIRRFDHTTPVVMITAFPDREVYEAAAALGAAMVLEKPFELEALGRLVHGVFAPGVPARLQ